MSLYGNLESGWKCPLRTLNNAESGWRRSMRNLERARVEVGKERLPEKELEFLAECLAEDIKKCREGYDFSGCENYTNEYYRTGFSPECCKNKPKRIAT